MKGKFKGKKQSFNTGTLQNRSLLRSGGMACREQGTKGGWKLSHWRVGYYQYRGCRIHGGKVDAKYIELPDDKPPKIHGEIAERLYIKL